VTDVARFRVRFTILFFLLMVPFFRMLIQHHYGFFHVEVFVAVLMTGALAATLAAVARNHNAFRMLVVACVVLLSVNTLQVNFMPEVRSRWITLGVTALVSLGMFVLRDKFYRILLIFVFGSCLGDIANAVAEYTRTREVNARTQAGKYDHVVHIILDEMAGLRAVPPECGECVRAAETLKQTLERGNFRIFPYAFSNYQGTRDSIPSILNGRLLNRTEEYLPDGESAARPFLRKNQYFETFLARNYKVRTYQSDFLRFDAPEYASVRSYTYNANSLKAFRAIPGPWSLRLRQLFAIYVQSDQLWWMISTRLLPSSLQLERIDVGPLAAQDVWPQRLLQDVRAADQNTLFLVHLLIPHRPYVYRADGSVRDLEDVISQTGHWVYDTNEYRELYRRYGEQVEFLAREIKVFLDDLKQTGLYDSTTIIIHGDHGSRIRLLHPGYAEQLGRFRQEKSAINPLSRYDYLGEPDASDLLDRFGTLLAIKPKGSQSAEVLNEPGSVLYFLEQSFGSWGGPNNPEALNSSYLFNADGSPHAIPMANILRDHDDRQLRTSLR
jgi:hypothetical protein